MTLGPGLVQRPLSKLTDPCVTMEGWHGRWLPPRSLPPGGCGDDGRTPDPGGRRREEHHRPGDHGAAYRRGHGRGGPHRRRRAAGRRELPAPPGGARRDAPRPRRLRGPRAHGPGAAVGGHPRALPHRPGRPRRPAPGSRPRGGRLHDQAVQRRGDAAPDQRHPAPDRGIRGARTAPRGRRPRAGRGEPRGPPGRRAGRPDAHRVPPPPLPDGQRRPGGVQVPDPRPGLGLQLRRQGEHGGGVRQLPAEEARRPRARRSSARSGASGTACRPVRCPTRTTPGGDGS